MPGARCTRGLVRKIVESWAYEHTGQRRQSDIPCAMALRLIASYGGLRLRLNPAYELSVMAVRAPVVSGTRESKNEKY